jgi:hypothetical protein
MESCSSDIRLKKDIRDAGEVLPWLETLRLRDFTMKASGERKTGVIAQEVMQLHPDMVHMGGNGLYTVDVPDTWRLVKAIQELKSDNDDLAERVRADDDAVKQAKESIEELRKSFDTYKDAHP